jgi:two-component system response regulator AtoC
MTIAPMPSPSALIVEADQVTRARIARIVEGLGYTAFTSTTVEEALHALSHQQFHIMVLAVNLAGSDGTELLRRLRRQGGATAPVVALIDGPEASRVPEAGAAGVDSFLQKPFAPEELEGAIKSALNRAPNGGARSKGDDARARLLQEVSLWRSSRMREVLEIVAQAAQVDVTVLVSGETGVGKDLVARAVHDLSARRAGPFVKVNCAAIPHELLESELFGHERGAFAGATKLKVGKFEAAHNGSIFLDDIDGLPPALQGKLLNVLQNGEFPRVGGRTGIKVDVRVLAATSHRLDRDVAAGQFREDLLYRLDVIHIQVPPLRERLEEIPALVEYFVKRYAAEFQRGDFKVSRETVQRLMRYRYPGNVRELENLVKRMVVLGDPLLVRSAFLGDSDDTTAGGPPGSTGGGSAAVAASRRLPPAPTGTEPPETIQNLKVISRRAAMAAEREAILGALQQTNWNRIRAAKLLGISYRALLYKIKGITGEPDSQRESAP